MLSFGAGSSCDVCFERFAQDSKAPCSIPCGHVFCVDCISNISRLCPLCRKPFDLNSCIKLHVDVDAIPPEQTSGCPLDEIKEAQRLHRALARIADVGIEEQGLRQLIQDTRNFLHGKPRHLFHDLRVAHRMVAYMCELKSDLRKQRSSSEALNDQMKTLAAEKEDLLNQLHQTEQDRLYERDMALAMEKSLREHYEVASRNYRVLIDVYNKLAQSTAELLNNGPLSCVAEKSAGTASGATRATMATMPLLDLSALEGVALRDSGSSFLISPLPQFTNALPSVLGGIAPLPELTEDIDGEEREEEDEDEDEISTPDSAQHDRSIEEQQEFHRQQTGAGDAIPPDQPDHFKAMQVSELSHTVHYHRARSHSIPSHSTSTGSPPSGRSASTSPPNLASHDLPPGRPSSYSHHSRETHSPAIRISNPDGDALRTRLHDLLRDSPTSSSLPNMTSSHFAALNKVDRDSPAPNTSSSPPSSHTLNPGRTPNLAGNAGDAFSHLLASGPQSSNRLAPVPSPSPFVGQRYSSASTEAKKLEEERRRKHLEERQQRREERHRAERQRDEKFREERHREGQEKQKEERNRVDHGRLHPDPDRDQSSKIPSSTTTPARWDQPISSNQSYIYANSNAVSPLKRRPSTGNAHSQPPVASPTPGPEHGSGQHGRYAAGSSGGHKSRPVPIPTNSAHIYS